MARLLLLRAVLVMAALACYAHAFYLPGVAPIEYNTGDRVYLSVNQLTSVHTQLPMRYYTLPFCQPEAIEDDRENLGEILLGDRIENSPYMVRMPNSSNSPQSAAHFSLLGTRLNPPFFPLPLCYA
jgi:transmembrane 9 superfamily protein 2/4